MADNPCQSYGQYANHQEASRDPISSGLVNNSLYQPSNIQYPVLQPSMSYPPNASMTPNASYHMNSTTQGSDISSDETFPPYDETFSDNAYFGMQWWLVVTLWNGASWLIMLPFFFQLEIPIMTYHYYLLYSTYYARSFRSTYLARVT